MKIELFNFVDNSIKLLNNYDEVLNEIAQNAIKLLKDILCDDDNFLNITYRIKSENSLREKIIKNNFFLKYEKPETMMLDLSDLIGIRLECRFIKEEEHLFNIIRQKFNTYVGDGYYKIIDDSPIMLKLSEKQPQIQKNGFEIYKIDGIYKYGKNFFRFELQIKSMVNVFWGEIDHKILYKNYNYMINEGFFKDIMASIKDSLYMVDKQLMILYDHVSSLDASDEESAKEQLNYLLSKIIHDVFSNKIKDDFGFVFNFKNSIDFIVEYLQMKAVKEKEISFGENFINLINKINKIDYSKMNIGEYIEFNKSIKCNDSFMNQISDTIIEIMNKDFSWHLFMKILYQIENSGYEENLQDFLYFLRYKYSLVFLDTADKFKLSKDEVNYVEDVVLKFISSRFKNNYSINYLIEFCLNEIKKGYYEIAFEEDISANYISSKLIARLENYEE
ncbi:GTP pyrophosphokinase [Peptoniphilus mikwangii]|uniref:GTP pyrophosphokinase n=1 Tax=Peptoniphilus mikwangii TaxID=1354300 RepID=UPI000408FE72|nr:(p)ppGpp synthetase [Peptoniphilus mikwangii]